MHKDLPLNDNAVWNSCSDLVDEMRNGMPFFEGYIPSSPGKLLQSSITELELEASGLDFSFSVWSNETTERDWNKEYAPGKYLTFFQIGKILSLHCDYSKMDNESNLLFKLIFDWVDDHRQELNIDIICYREGILPVDGSKVRFLSAVQHMRFLKSLFSGTALFIGPATENYPNWPELIPDEWTRIK